MNNKQILMILIIIQLAVFSFQTYIIATRTGFVSIVNAQTKVFVGETAFPTVDGAVFPMIVITGEENTILTIKASDNFLDNTWAVVTLPDGSSQNISLVNLLGYDYIPNMSGRYGVVFYANDTSGNVAHSSTKNFISGPPETLNLYVVNNSLDGINSILHIYYENELYKSLHSNSEKFTRLVDNVVYDLVFESYDGKFQAGITNVNITINNNRKIILDRFTQSSFLVVFGIDSDIIFNKAILNFYYGDTEYMNESRLFLYKCDNWDFANRQCLSHWYILNATQNNDTDFFQVSVNSFSGFGIIEEYCGDGICNNILETCSNCAIDCGICSAPPQGSSVPAVCFENWECSDWSNCTNGYQIRNCIDLDNCGTSYHKPYDTKICDIPPAPIIIEREKIVEKIIEKEKTVEKPSSMCENTNLIILAVIFLITTAVLIVISVFSRAKEWLWLIFSFAAIVILSTIITSYCSGLEWIWLIIVLIAVAFIYKIFTLTKKKKLKKR